MRVAVVVGVAVEFDAISSAALEQVASLRGLPQVDEVFLYTQGTDQSPPCPTFVLGSPWELLHHPEFRRCDVAIFHWGIYFALFDAITLLDSPSLPTPVVHFHNCTPPALVEESHRENIQRSIHQVSHVIGLGVHFWTYSEFNRRTLLEWGAEERQLDWVTFPVPFVPPHVEASEAGSIRLLSVGRLVPAKGADVIVAALQRLPAALLARTHATIVSSTTFSSDEYRVALLEQIRDAGPLVGAAVHLVTEPTAAELARIYAETDILVSASFHEGLCVPVIEAYASGCRVIGTTAGNLPFIVIPPDPVVEPGDPAALADAIESVAGSLEVDDAAYRRRQRDLVDSFSPAGAATMLGGALQSVMMRRRDVSRSATTAAG